MASLNFPANPADGDYYEGFSYDGTIGVWKRVGGSGAASMTVSETPPTQGLTSGAMWLDSTTGNTYIYYEDGDNSQWVQSAGAGLVATRNSDFKVQTTAPANPVDGDIWYDPTEGFTYIYYEDQDSSQWVQFGLNRNGAPGIDGAAGADGIGIPAGGTEGQALVKSSATDYAIEWGSVAGGGGLLTLDSDTINVDFNDSSSLYTRSVAGNVTFTGSDYTAGATKKIYLQGDTVQRSLTFPAGWTFLNDKPTAIGANRKNMLDLNSFGTSESTTVAIWLGASAFESIVATGGTESVIAIDGVQWRVHSFTSGGSLSVSSVGSIGQADYLIVAGGGGGGGYYSGGGGGAGGLLTSVSGEVSGGLTLPGSMVQLTEIDYLVTVGAGGAGGAGDSSFSGSNGQDSSFAGMTAIGGGGGGSGGLAGLNGGCGGGAGGNGQATGNYLGGTGTQGFDGGDGYSNATNYGAGGGGGAGSAGLDGDNSASGAAGVGVLSSITGQNVYYSGGGGAGTHTGNNTTRTLGGLGGGGDGGLGGGNNNGFPGTANTGGGGGGATYQTSTGAVGGAGGSGIVIVRYPITDPN